MVSRPGATAQDDPLTALRATLVGLHSQPAPYDFEAMGPELTRAKHQLRDWIEGQLGSLDDARPDQSFSSRINEALASASVKEAEDGENLLGSLGEVRIDTKLGIVTITTGVGILCQQDESAYGYQHINGRWQRIWESEQTDYSPKKYAPQYIEAVHVSRSFHDGKADGPLFVMTLGHHWGCASVWHPVYYRVWRVDPTGPKLLIDESAFAYLRADRYAQGSIGQDAWDKNAPVDVLIEFAVRSIDDGVHSREAVRHFLIEGDKVRRVAPVALSPRDFVDEWVTRRWGEAAAWSASPPLRTWHGRLHKDFVAAGFAEPTKHCQSPDLWQVPLEPTNAEKDFAAEPTVYFLVRWRPPYHFTMMNIGDTPWPGCTQVDREANEWRTLFATQDWR